MVLGRVAKQAVHTNTATCYNAVYLLYIRHARQIAATTEPILTSTAATTTCVTYDAMTEICIKYDTCEKLTDNSNAANAILYVILSEQEPTAARFMPSRDTHVEYTCPYQTGFF